MGLPTIAASLLLLFCSVSLITATPTGHLAQHDEGPYLSDSGVPASGYVDGELLAQLLSLQPKPALSRSPSKRQWCADGMVYNHVIGSCMMSFAAMRARGRG